MVQGRLEGAIPVEPGRRSGPQEEEALTVQAGPLFALRDAWQEAITMGEGTVLAVLTEVTGPSYRDLGTAMAIGPNGQWIGAITSGCIEADIALHAAEVRRTGNPRSVKYGKGSPYLDMRLPCGGGITVSLFPLLDVNVLIELERLRGARQPCAIRIDSSYRLQLLSLQQTGPSADGFVVAFPLPVRHVIFGAGPEALVFAGLVAAMGRDHILLSRDEATLAAAPMHGCRARQLPWVVDIESIGIDPMTAVTLFYHDHDKEPEILQAVLASSAFYVGAQGSMAAQETRRHLLAELGVPEEAVSRLRGPIGLVMSTRTAQDLAISVLAEITDVALRRRLSQSTDDA